MKLRLHDNTIRLRLSRGEVDRLVGEGRVEESIAFASGARLGYALVASAGAGAVGARFEGGRLVVEAPADAAAAWARSNETGIEAAPETGPRILIEKDFQCLHAPESPDADAFPNPAAR